MASLLRVVLVLHFAAVRTSACVGPCPQLSRSHFRPFAAAAQLPKFPFPRVSNDRPLCQKFSRPQRGPSLHCHPKSSLAMSAETTEAPRIVGPDGLTNKERRLAKQAEKRKRAEGGESEVVADPASEPPKSTPSAPAPAATDGLTNKERRLARQAEKRKRAKGGDVDADADAGEADDAANAEEEEDLAEPEAISHKEKRKRRKLEKKGLLPMQGEDGQDESGASSAARPPPSSSLNALPARSQYSLWVGNMNFMTSPERLQSWFEDKGIEGISRVHMPKGMKKFEQNKG